MAGKKDVPDKEPVSTIGEALTEAYDEQESAGVEAEPVETTDEPVEVAEETTDERPRGPDGKFIKQEEPEVPAVAEAEPEAEVIEPEEHWSEADKAAFRNIPPEHRQWVFERYKRIEADNTRKSQEAAQLRSYKQQLDSVLEPYRQQFALAGMDEISGIRYLMGVRDMLSQNPQQGIQWLAQQYGVDLSALLEQAPADPQYLQIQQGLQQIQSRQAQLEQMTQMERQNQAIRQLESFASEKDANGNLKHPHFEALQERMAQLWQGGIVPVGDLEGAYQKAVRIEGLDVAKATAPTAPKTAPKVEDKALAAAKAKKAAAGVQSGASGKADKKLTMREELEARLEGNLH